MPDLRERLSRAWCFGEGDCHCGSESDCTHWKVWVEAGGPDAALSLIAEALREPASAGMCRATVDESGLIATLPADVWERMAAAWLREQGVSDGP